MAVIPSLIARDGSKTTARVTPTMINLLIAFATLLFFGFLLLLALYVFRSRRKAMQIQKLTELPFQAQRSPHKTSNHRRLTATASRHDRSSVATTIYNEKELMVETTRPYSPTSPLPEIRITFPEEEDEAGKPKSGRVVIVRISEMGGVGLEPLKEDHLPPYQKSDAERFQSLDLDRMGGLKEKI